MRSRPGRGRSGWWGRGSTCSRQPVGRLCISLETLEPRLLLTGWTATEPARSADLRSPADHGAVAAIVGPLPPTPGSRSEANASVDEEIAPLSAAPYLIVPEVAAFHGTVSTAQAIPDVPYVGVGGNFGTGEPIDLYRVVMGPGALVLRLASAYDQTGGTPLLRLSVYNALGRLIGMATTSDGVVDLTFTPAGSNLAPGATLFVGVNALGPVGGEPSGVDYQLWFLRTPEVSTSGLGVESAAQGVGGSGTVTVAPALVSGPGTVSPGSSQSPALAAAPSGGVLSDSAPTRPVAWAVGLSDAGRVFDPRTLETELVRSESEPPTRQAAQSREPSALVALRGPGGLPVFAALTSGDWHDERNSPEESTKDGGAVAAILIVPAVSCVMSAPAPTPCAHAASAQGGFTDQAAPRLAALSSIYIVSAVNSPFVDPVREDRQTTRPRRRSKRARGARSREPNGTDGSLSTNDTDSCRR